MAISDTARTNHDQLFPDHRSALADTDAELIEIFDNFAFDDVNQASGLDVRTLVAVRDEEPVEINAGDVIFAPDGEEHWHGAAPDHFMTDLSITDGAAHW
jgi:hypothetical protein